MDQELLFVWEVTKTGGGVVGLMVVLVIFGRWVFGVRAQRAAEAEARTPEKGIGAVLGPSALSATTTLEEERQLRQAFQRELTEAQGFVVQERERADRYFRSIETIERERNRWFEAYELASTQHANAQGLMLADLGRLGRRIDKAREVLQREPVDVALALQWLDARPDPKLEGVWEAYKATHGPEGLRAEIERSEPDLTAAEQEIRSSTPPRA